MLLKVERGWAGQVTFSQPTQPWVDDWSLLIGSLWAAEGADVGAVISAHNTMLHCGILQPVDPCVPSQASATPACVSSSRPFQRSSVGRLTCGPESSAWSTAIKVGSEEAEACQLWA